MLIKNLFQRACGLIGLKACAASARNEVQLTAFHSDMEEEFRLIYSKCAPFTMTSVLRMYALYNANRYLSRQGIVGDMVECGVWKGGSSMITALTLLQLGDSYRNLFLYDTFAGMTAPTEKDRKFTPLDVKQKWEESQRDGHNEWCYSSIDEVRANLLSTGYPKDRLNFIEGRVEQTIPGVVPERIALLRLDTDFYESTYHEFLHLYPRLAVGGVLIIDDYGTWQGARDATEEYFAQNNINLLLNKIDNTARIAIKA